MKTKPIIGGEYYKIKWDNSLPPFMVDIRRDTRTKKLVALVPPWVKVGPEHWVKA